MKSPEQTQLSNPPTEQTKMTKVRVLSAIHVARLSRIVNPSEEIEMTDAEIKEFCDKKFKGPYAHTGEIQGKARHQMIRRAIRLRDAEEIERRNREIEAEQAS